MRKLSALDLAFFIAESKGSPKSVAGLMVCKKPVRAPANFCRNLVKGLKTYDQPSEPFNLVIQFLGLKGPHWRPCDSFDIDEHVFYHKPRSSIGWPRHAPRVRERSQVSARSSPVQQRRKSSMLFEGQTKMRSDAA